MKDIFQILRTEHSRIQEALNHLTAYNEKPDHGNDTQVRPSCDWIEKITDIQCEITGHHRAEEAVFYDTLRWIPHQGELADFKQHEHRRIESALSEIKKMSLTDSELTSRMLSLKDLVCAHFNEEETKLFAIIRPIISSEKSAILGEQFETLRELTFETAKYRLLERTNSNLKDVDFALDTE